MQYNCSNHYHIIVIIIIIIITKSTRFHNLASA